eukprot:SAG31_NODE_12734_length_920_cov_1.628502_1_plen_235_part_10
MRLRSAAEVVHMETTAGSPPVSPVAAQASNGEKPATLKPEDAEAIIMSCPLLEKPDDASNVEGHGWFGRNEEFFVHDIYPRLHLPVALLILAFFLKIGPDYCPNTAGVILVAYTSFRVMRGLLGLIPFFAALWRFSHRSRQEDNKALWEAELQKHNHRLRMDDVVHSVGICAYKEPPATLHRTLDSLASQSVASNIIITLALESRDPTARAVADQLYGEYHTKFPRGFHVTLHEL